MTKIGLLVHVKFLQKILVKNIFTKIINKNNKKEKKKIQSNFLAVIIEDIFLYRHYL